ncbi:hypothetical protein LCGC14_0709170 [marine sediment metagenome]|uniref:EamA domain-containing protein n=1 Tax=marine sediment metagenome TaxID=412755 RepID=A0A0F9QK62_9ZZZZ
MAGELTAILAVLCFVISNVIFRKTEHDTSPVYINFFRTGIGAISFVIIALVLNIFIKIFLIPWEIWIILIISFVFGQVVGDTAYFKAQKELGVTVAIAVSMTFPLFTFILSLLFLNQVFDVKIIFSMLLIGGGIILIGKSKIESSNNDISNTASESITPGITLHKISKGYLFRALSFGLIASLGWAIALVMIDFATNEIDKILQAKQNISSIIGNVIRFPFASLMLTSLVWRESYITKKRENLSKQKKSSKIYILLLVGSIIGTSIGVYVYTEAARIAGATTLALIASASPLFALPLTYFINKEKISKLGFFGVIVTILGVIMIII